jgi:hypothetical protein
VTFALDQAAPYAPAGPRACAHRSASAHAPCGHHACARSQSRSSSFRQTMPLLSMHRGLTPTLRAQKFPEAKSFNTKLFMLRFAIRRFSFAFSASSYFCLVHLQTAVLLAPAIVRLLRNRRFSATNTVVLTFAIATSTCRNRSTTCSARCLCLAPYIASCTQSLSLKLVQKSPGRPRVLARMLRLGVCNFSNVFECSRVLVIAGSHQRP